VVDQRRRLWDSRSGKEDMQMIRMPDEVLTMELSTVGKWMGFRRQEDIQVFCC
jgi:hypothetical protein